MDDQKKEDTLYKKTIQSFWDKQSQINAFSIFIGLLAVLGCAFLVGYISSVRVNYANQFYDIIFTVNILEDLKPGTKVRYQGGLIIGEVKSIKSNNQGHKLYAKIKNDFFIPRQNQRTTIKTWGFFGSKFINITILNPDTKAEMFKPGETVPIEDLKDSEFLIRKMKELFSKKDENSGILLEEKLLEIRALAKEITSNAAFNKDEVRQNVRSVLNEIIVKLAVFNEVGQKGYEQISKINDGTSEKIASFKSFLPKLQTQVKDFSIILNYEKSIQRKKMMYFLHDETTYNHVNEYLIYIKNTLFEYRDNPRRIIFRD